MSVEISEKDLEELLLVAIHRTRTLADRFPDDPLSLGLGLNSQTGAPESANDLKRPGAIRVRGEKLQREAFYMPRTLAEIHLRRSCEKCERCQSGAQSRCENAPAFRYVHRDEWTDDEAADVAELEARIHRVFERWEAEGMMIRQPPILFTGALETEKNFIAPEGKDQWAWMITSKGIDRARVAYDLAGDWKADNRRSPLWVMTDKQRRNAPQWQQKEFVDEGGAISGGPDAPSELVSTKCSRCERWHPSSHLCPVVATRRPVGLLERIFGRRKK